MISLHLFRLPFAPLSLHSAAEAAPSYALTRMTGTGVR